MMKLYSTRSAHWVSGFVRRSPPPKICQNVGAILSLCRIYHAKPFRAQENSMVRYYDDSFQKWILNLFVNDPKYSSFAVSDAKIDAFNPDDMDFDSLLSCLWTKKAQEALTPLLLRKIDAALNARISLQTPAQDLLKCLQICVTSVPIQAAKMESFRNAVIQLENRIKKSKLTAHDVVQTMYYASHLKNGVLVKKFMQAASYHLDTSKMENLSTLDLGIYCVSLFRSAVPVEKAVVLTFLEKRFRGEISYLLSEHSAVFVSFVKCFRLSKHYEEELLEFVASQGQAELAKLDVTARTHLAVWFAAADYGDVGFVGPFLASVAGDMSSRMSENAVPRLKDVDNLLWSSACFGLSDVNDVISNGKIPEYVRDRLSLARNEPHLQISLLTWLWMCGCRLEREVVRYVTPETVAFIKGSKNFKSVANLYLLMTCAEVEAPGLLKPNLLNARDHRLQPKVPKYLEKRLQLKGLLATLQKHKDALQLDNLRFDFLVPGLYIGGIYAEHRKKPVCIEVFDSAVCLSNSRHLKGRMKLKLRLLEEMGLSVLKVEPSKQILEGHQDAENKEFLDEWISRLDALHNKPMP